MDNKSLLDTAILRYKKQHAEEMILLKRTSDELEMSRVNAAVNGTSQNWLNFDHIGMLQQRAIRIKDNLDKIVSQIGKLELAKG